MWCHIRSENWSVTVKRMLRMTKMSITSLFSIFTHLVLQQNLTLCSWQKKLFMHIAIRICIYIVFESIQLLVGKVMISIWWIKCVAVMTLAGGSTLDGMLTWRFSAADPTALFYSCIIWNCESVRRSLAMSNLKWCVYPPLSTSRLSRLSILLLSKWWCNSYCGYKNELSGLYSNLMSPH